MMAAAKVSNRATISNCYYQSVPAETLDTAYLIGLVCRGQLPNCSSCQLHSRQLGWLVLRGLKRGWF